MPSPWDASIKLLYGVDQGTFFTLDDLALDAPFDVIANVEIGENLNEVVDSFTLRVGIRNLTTSETVAIEELSDALKPENNTPRTEERRVEIPSGWAQKGSGSNVGDVLQAVASYKVVAGINTDFSTAESDTFVVS
jgi:hypothetical protein